VPTVRGLCAGLCLLSALGSTAGAQALRLDRPQFEVGGELDGSWLTYPALPGTTLGTAREWLGITLGASIPYPGIFSVFGTFYPTWTQKRRADEAVLTETGTGNRLNYRLGAQLLSAQPVSVAGWAARSDGTDPDLFAGPRLYNAGDYGGRLELRSTAVPAFVEYSVRTIEETWLQPTGEVHVRNERLDAAHAQLQTRTLRLFGERLDLEDRLDGRDFTSYLGSLYHDLRWGWGSMLQSGVRYFDRTGFMTQRTAAWTEHARIQHVPGFATDLTYEQSRVEIPGLEQRLWNAAGGFIIEPGPFLRIAPAGEARWRRFTTGSRDELRAIPQVSVSIPIARRVWFGARAMVGYEWQRLEPTADGTIRVFNESHVIDASGRFALFEPFADTTSVVLTNADETLLYDRDVDYRVAATGDLVEILVLPQGRIVTGDSVLVDYAYRLTPDTRAQGLIASYGADLTIAGFTAYARREQRELDGADAAPALLPSYDNVTAGASLRQGFGPVILDGGGEYQRRELDGVPFEFWLGRAGITFVLPAGLRVHGAGRRSVNTGGAGTRYEISMGEAGLEWMPVAALRLRGRAATWWWDEASGRQERFVGGGAEATLRVGLLQLGALVDHGVWTEGFERTTTRAAFHLSRRF
jgi:hypothetical protein